MNVISKGFLAAASLGALLAGAAEAKTVLTMNSWLPPSHPQVSELLVPWAEDVKKATDGRVEIKILPAPLGPPPAAFDLAKNGVADITYSVQGYTPGRFNTAAIAEIPFLSDDAVATSVAFMRVQNAMLGAAGEYAGVHVLSVYTHGPGEIFSTKPITAPEDVAGQKIRTGGAMAHDIAVELGAAPVEGPSSKAYELLSQGVADGIFFPFETVNFFNLNDVLKFGYTVPGGLYNTGMFLVMNEGKWNALPPEDKAAIEPLIGEAFSRRAGEMWNRVDARGREAMAGKIAIEAASPEAVEALRARLAPVVQKRIEQASKAGIDGQAAYDMMKAEIAKIEAAD